MHTASNIKQQRLAFYALGFFALLFAAITFVNHYCYRTSAYDLGINNNAIYDYAHFRWNDCMLMQPQFTNVLSDHFSLLPIIVSPLYWILGSYTMLFVQWAGVLFGGYGIYIFFKRKTDNSLLPVLAMIHFFCIWGVYSALAYDYHDNVMAAMFVPWFINYFDKQKWGMVALFYVLILISKENMALWMVFIAVGLGLLYWRNRKMLAIAVGLSVVAAAYFAFVVHVAIPYLGNADRDYLHFRYAALGHNFTEAFTTIITRPLYTLEVMFINHNHESTFDGIKVETHYMVLLAGGWALFYKPQYLVMLIPIYAQKLFSNDSGKWGLLAQYSIEFVPILCLAVFGILVKLKDPKLAVKLGIAVCVVAMGTTIWKLDGMTSKWYAPKPARFYSPKHYKQDFNIPEMQRALDIIPDSAKVSAVNFLVPHLAFRDYIYQYPHIFNASYVVLAIDTTNVYPFRLAEEMRDSMEAFKRKPDWEVIYDKNLTMIARKRKP